MSLGIDPGPRLRVLIAAETFLPSVNGVTNSVLQVAGHLAARGHQPFVVAPEPAPATVGDVPVIRVASRQLPLYRGLPVSMPSRHTVDRLLDEIRPDVVHLAAPTLLGARFAERAERRNLPVIALFQTDLAGFARSYHLGALSPLVWRWLRSVHRRADLTLVPSNATRIELAARGIPRIGVWARGVDHEQFRPDRRSEAFRARVLGPVPASTILVGYVGRLAREKRVEQLSHVTRDTDAKLIVVGDGPDATRIRRRLPAAHFTGLLRGPALAEAMASLDVFVHTGPNETFGQSIQEAMASGLPVVAPAAGGPLDLVEPGVTGYLYTPDRPEELARAVASLAANPALRREMGRAGLARTRDRTWERLGDDLVGIYRHSHHLHSDPTHSHPTHSHPLPPHPLPPHPLPPHPPEPGGTADAPAFGVTPPAVPTKRPTERSTMIDLDALTVVVPTRNEAGNIGRFLASLPPGVRLIVVDSSTDGTPRIVAALRPHNTIVVLAEANIPEARQIGAEMASTPWILFADADVELDPDYAAELSRLRVGSDIGGIVGAKSTAGGHERYHQWFHWGQRMADALGIPAATGSNMLVRRSVLEQTGGFDPRLSVNEDTELMFRIRRAGWKVPFVPGLQVRCHDHRRLERGKARKLGHSLARCALLWLAPASSLARRGDWGYWSATGQARARSNL